MQDMTFILGPDQAAAEIWETLGAAGVAIEAACTFPAVDGRVIRVVLADADVPAARQVLLDAGFGAVDRHEVIITDIESRPEALGELARRLEDTGAKLTTLYMAMGNRVVIGAVDLNKVKALLGHGD